jgi:hypothetical protein
MLKRLGCRFNPKTRHYEPPSEPTIRRFLQEVDAEAVDNALYGWLQSLSGQDSAIAPSRAPDKKTAARFICFLHSSSKKAVLSPNVRLTRKPTKSRRCVPSSTL